MATKAERELAALRDAQTDADPSNDPSLDDLRAAEQAVADQGRRPEDVIVDRRAEFHALRAEQAVPNPEGEWLLPVDDRGRNLLDPAAVLPSDAPA